MYSSLLRDNSRSATSASPSKFSRSLNGSQPYYLSERVPGQYFSPDVDTSAVRHAAGNLSRSGDVSLSRNTENPRLEEKELLIYDLRRQVSELIKDKEQMSNLRNQISLLHEREKLRDNQTEQNNDELLETIKHLEEEATDLRIHLKQAQAVQHSHNVQSRQELTLLQAHGQAENSALSRDNERIQSMAKSLEYELSLASKNINTLQGAASEEKHEFNNTIRQLQNTITTNAVSTAELESRNALLERRMQAMEGDLNVLLVEKEQLQKSKIELANSIAELQQQLHNTELKYEHAAAEGSLVTGLRKQLELIPAFRDEVAHHEHQDGINLRTIAEMRVALDKVSSELVDARKQNKSIDVEAGMKAEGMARDLVNLSRQVRSYQDDQQMIKAFIASLCQQLNDLDVNTSSRHSRATIPNVDSVWDDLHRSLQEQVAWLVAGYKRLLAESQRTSDAQQQLEEMGAVHQATLHQLQSSHDHQLADLHQSNDHLQEELSQAQLLGFSTDQRTISNLQSLEDDLQRAKDDIEQLFYAVQLLIRGLRPFRYRYQDLILQKTYLRLQVESSETALREVFGIVGGIGGQQVPKIARKATFRAAAVAVIAANRLLRLPSIGAIGPGHIINRRRINVAPPDVIHCRDIPPLPAPAPESSSAEAEAFYALVEHFDSVERLEGQQFSQTMIHSLTVGLHHFQRQLKRSGPVNTSSTATEAPELPSTSFSTRISMGDNIALLRKRARSWADQDQHRNAQLTQSLSSAEETSRRLEQELRTLAEGTHDSEQLRARSEAAEKERDTLKQAIGAKNAVLVQAEAAAEEYRREIDEREVLIRGINSRAAEREIVISEMEQARQGAHHSLLEVQAEVQLVRAQKHNYQQQAAELAEQLRGSEVRVAQVETKSSALQAAQADGAGQVGALRSALGGKEEELVRSRDLIVALQEALQKAQSRATSLNERLDVMRSAISKVPAILD